MSQIRVLICPLDWGLGHASRCIPIIDDLIKQNAEVLIAGDGEALILIKNHFPDLKFLYLKGYRIKLFKNLSAGSSLAIQTPALLYRVFIENKQLKKIVTDHGINVVISDNRYGLWCEKIFSVFITHQLNIIPPFLPKIISPLLRKISRYFISKYNECWIPDNEGKVNLSGKLSHGHALPVNVRFIGFLSRFDTTTTKLQAFKDEILDNDYKLVALVSGPEPQRSVFEDIVKSQLVHVKIKSLLIRGKVAENKIVEKSGNLTVVNHLGTVELLQILKKYPVVICRGGYSTLMDLSYIGNKIICIPTPGQTEQEYLSVKGHEEKFFVSASQNNFDLNSCLSALNKLSDPGIPHSKSLYREQIKRITEMFMS